MVKGRTFLHAVGAFLLCFSFAGAEKVVEVIEVLQEQPPTLPDQPVEPEIPEQPVTPQTPPPSPFDLPLSYPSLSELQIGGGTPFNGSTGVLRDAMSVFDTPAAVDIVTRQEILEKQAPSMFHALQNEVGIMMQSTAAGQASPFVRGVTGQQVLLLVDGIRLNNSVYRLGPNQYFNTIDPGMVDHIEVLRGQGSVLWGSDAIGGVINVVTRSADFAQRCCGGYEGVEFQQYFNTSDQGSYSRMNVEGWVDRFGYFGGGSWMNVDDLDTGFGFGVQPGTHYQQYAGDIKLNYLIDCRRMLTFSMQHFEQQNLPRSDRFPGYPGDLNNSNTVADSRYFDPQQRDLIYLRYQAIKPHRLADAVTFTASYQRQREAQTRAFRDPIRIQERDVETVGMQLVMAKQLGCYGGKITYGADWYHDDIDSPTLNGDPIDPDDGTYERFGMFLNWNVDLTCDLAMHAGVRYENIDAASTPIVPVGVPPVDTPIPIFPHYNDVIGSIGFVYEVNPCVHLVGSISEGFRAPNLDELAANNPNVQQLGQDLPSLDLRPENSVTYEIGLKTDFERFRSNLFVFWTDLDNNIVAAPTPDEFTFSRANQDSFIQGVEFDAEMLLQCGWSLYGNFWYTYGVNQVLDTPLSRIPPTQGIIGLRWRDPCLRSYFSVYAWLVRHQDRLDPVRDLGDERIPPGGTPGYATLNVRMGRAFGQWQQHRVSLSVENITDKAYLVHGSGVFGSGITGRFGYAFDW